MDFKSLEYFVVVAKELNISRASRLLNISQPPLSSRIKHLEEELGTILFERGKNGLTLTPSGAVLYKRARQILDLERHTREELANYDNALSGDLRIGTVEGRAPYLLARYIAGFKDEFPLVTYTVRSGGSDEVLDQLNHHQIDIAVIAAPFDQERYEGLALGKQPWVALIPQQHPLASKPGQSVTLQDLASEALIVPERHSRVRAIEQWFGEKQLTPAILGRTSNYINAVALAEQNAGICIFPQSTYTPNPHIVIKLITDPPKIAEYFLVWPKNDVLTELSEAFRDYVEDFLAQDLVNSERFRTKEEEFEIPKDADLL
ncbi:MAG: LysR family transcriptional regulator [Lachnospiraceae bacterium]|nr:LysR family transcriptional regulator [Lachnospiraceae bacterium]